MDALAAKIKFYPRAYMLGIFAYACYAVYKFFCQDGVLDWIRNHRGEDIAATMQAEKPWIEETREFFGLVIVIVVLMINYAYFKVKQKRVLSIS